jgi:hypothetical protein
MCTVRLDAATLASIQDGTISPERAQEILHDLKGQLRNTDGSIKPGVLSFSRETGVISTARWWDFGSRSSEKMAETANLMKELISSAYRDVYTGGVEADLEAYLTTTSSKFGSESFVKLIDSLERLEAPEGGEGPAKGAPTPGRLQLGNGPDQDILRRSPASARVWRGNHARFGRRRRQRGTNDSHGHPQRKNATGVGRTEKTCDRHE